jgi:hypothetical protein
MARNIPFSFLQYHIYILMTSIVSKEDDVQDKEKTKLTDTSNKINE